MDGFKVSHTKDGFQWDSSKEHFLETLRKHLNELPMPLIDQARDASYSTFRKKKDVDDDIGKFVDEAVKDTGEILEAKVTPVLGQQIRTEPREEALPPSLPKVQESWKEEFTLEIHSIQWKVTVEITNNPGVSDWVDVFDTTDKKRVNDMRQLGVSLSLSHPFTERFVGADPDRIKPFIRIAAAIGLAEITAREAGAQSAGAIRRNINQLLRDVLSQS